MRIAHLSPDSPAVDVALTPSPADRPAVDPGDDVASALGYGDVGRYRDLAPGSYAVSVRPAGTSTTAPPALSTRVEVPAGGVRTLALTGAFADLALTSLSDDLTAPPPGSARVRVLAAAAGAPTLDVAVVDGPTLGAALTFPAAGEHTAVPAGTADLRLTTADGATTVPVDLAPGSVASLLVLDAADGGLTVRAVVDAVAPAVPPVGAVEAGGAAPPPARFPRLAVDRSAVDPAGPEDVVPSVDAAPVRVRVPAVGIDGALTGTGLDASGALPVPSDPATAGWYAAGPAPGRRGPAVLAGHVDWAGHPAVFDGLRRVAPGDAIEVDRADGSTVRFVVDRVAQVDKAAFPTAAVYGPVPGAELRLITCGGVYDPAAGSYRDNLVVFARLTG